MTAQPAAGGRLVKHAATASDSQHADAAVGRRASRGPVDPRMLRHARSSRGGIALLGALGLGQAAATLLVAIALTQIVAGTRGHAPLAGSRGQAIALLAAAFAARAALSWAEQVVAQRTAARVTDELRRSVLAAALRRGPAWVARYGSGRLTAVLTNGLDALRPWFSGYLPALVLGVALPPLVIVAMALVDPGSALIALLTLPLIPVLGALIGWATQATARQRWEADARLAGHFLDVVRGLTTLRVYGRAERQIDVVAEMTDRHRGATMRVLRVAFLSSTALDLVGTLSVGLIAVEAGLRVAGGSLALGPALLVILLAPEAYRPLREVAARFHASADAAAVIADVDEVLTDPATQGNRVAWTFRALLGARGVRAEESAVGVAADGLRIRYPGSTVDALRMDRLVVRGGEFVALRGRSGAGKTTALRALAGMQPIDAGRVDVGGPTPLYLSQRPTLPHARVVADVFGGDIPADVISAALRLVGLDRELTPDTALGERGQGVSAGQRQRLALAALLWRARRAPVVLLLDEPTAHLDAATEELVIAELRAAADRGCAVLAVAHRPALLTAAGAIVDVVPPTAADAIADAVRPAAADAITGAVAPLGAPDIESSKGRADTSQPRSDSPAPLMPVGPASKPSHGEALPRRGWWSRPGVAVALGAASWLAGITLTGAAAWLLVRASTLPPVLTLSAAVVLVRASAVARPLLRYLERLVSHDVAFARLGARRARVFASLIPLMPGPRLHRRGELLTRLVGDVDAQLDGLLRGRLPALAAAAALSVGSVVAVLVDPTLAVPLAAGLVVAAVIAPALAARQAAGREAATGRARAELRDAVVETVDGLEDLASPTTRHGTRAATQTANEHADQATQTTPHRTRAAAEAVGGLEEPAARGRGWAAVSRARVASSEASATVSGGAGVAVPEKRSRVLALLEARAARAAGMAAAFGHLGWGVAVVGAAVVLSRADGPAPEWAAALLLGIVALGEPIAGLPAAAVARLRASAADGRLAALTAEPTSTGPAGIATKSAATSHAVATPISPTDGVGALDGWGDVVVRGLVAGWDPGREAALRGIDLDLPVGSRVAVIGPSGGGKSTLAAVLARLLDPRSGTVTIGGVDARTVPDQVIRHRIALVGDDADHIFASTVRENLRLARPDADDRALTAALDRVGLPGWDLDRFLGAGGTTISGGQRRRFATARALLADPALLILDEPTEGLDEAGAQALMADLLDAAAGRTVLVLTHRTEGLDRVDRVHVLDAGRIKTLTTAAA